jgi:hypothetical protein
MRNHKILCLLFLFSSLLFSQNVPKTGLLFDDSAYDKTPMKARNVAFQDVISEQSSTSLKDFVPVIKNQGGYGTCVGWSTAYYGRTILNARIENLTTIEDISKSAFSPVFTYLNANTEDDYNCQGGAFIGKAMNTMVDVGSLYFSDYDVMCDTAIPEGLLEKASENKIKDFTRLFGDDEVNEVKIESVKRSLVNGNPVVIGFLVENSFYTAENVFEPDNAGTTGGHAMCVIGYDDEKYGGSFEIVNSWGTNWGNNGFIWVRYADFATYSKYAFEMIPQKKIAKKKKKIEKSILEGELELKLYDGSIMEVTKQPGVFQNSVLGWQDVVVDKSSQSIGDYTTKTMFPSETKYRMYAKVNKPAYVYVIGADSNGDSGVLFPHEEGISPYINYEGTSVVIPGERLWFRMSGDVSSDYSIVIFSQEKIDPKEVKKKIDGMEGNLLDKLYVIFKDDLIHKDAITLNEDSVGFRAEYDKGTMAMMILDIKRK